MRRKWAHYFIANGSLLSQSGLFLILLSPLAYYKNIYYDSEFAKQFIFWLGLTLFLVRAIYDISKEKNAEKKLHLNYFSVFLFLSWLCGFAGNLFYSSLQRDYPVVLLYLAQVLLYVLWINYQEQINWKNLLLFFLYVAAINCLIGVLQRYGINFLGLKQMASPASTFINRNYAAHYLNLVWPLIFWVPLKDKGEIYPLRIISCFLICYYILSTGTRGLWVALVGSLLLFFLLTILFRNKLGSAFKTMRFPLVLLLVSLAIFLIIDPLFKQAGESDMGARLASISDVYNGSAAIRLTIWQNALHMAKDLNFLPIGHGAMPFYFHDYVDYPISIGAPDYALFFQHIHNEFIRVLVESGGLGLVFFLVAWGALVRILWNRIREGQFFTMNLLGTLAFFSISIHSVFEFPQFSFVSGIFFPLFFGLISYRETRSLAASETFEIKSLMLKGRWEFLLVGILLAGIMLYVSVQSIIGGRLFVEAQKTAEVSPTACREIDDLYRASLRRLRYEPHLAQDYPLFISKCFDADNRTAELLEIYALRFPHYPALRSVLALVWYRLGNHDKVRLHLAHLNKYQPSNSVRKVLLGIYAAGDKKIDVSKQLIGEAVRHRPELGRFAEIELQKLSPKERTH